MEKISESGAIKQYFSTPERPVTFEELKELALKDKPGFHELAVGAAKALGVELTVSVS